MTLLCGACRQDTTGQCEWAELHCPGTTWQLSTVSLPSTENQDTSSRICLPGSSASCSPLLSLRCLCECVIRGRKGLECLRTGAEAWGGRKSAESHGLSSTQLGPLAVLPSAIYLASLIPDFWFKKTKQNKNLSCRATIKILKATLLKALLQKENPVASWWQAPREGSCFMAVPKDAHWGFRNSEWGSTGVSMKRKGNQAKPE